MEEALEYGQEGLGLAEAAGLLPQQQSHFNFAESFWHYFQSDLISSIPITICSFLLLFVIIERTMFFNRNNRDISSFIHGLQHQLERQDLESAQMLSAQMGSVVGEIAEEGVRLLAVQNEDFGRAYDITTNIVTRKLQKYLPILATIGAVAPFLGLFGTVSGVIKALYKMSLGAEGASMSMIGEISNALIATGYGLAIAIIAVVCNNLFNNIVRRYGDDFMLLKLLFLSFVDVEFHPVAPKHQATQQQRPQQQPSTQAQQRQVYEQQAQSSQRHNEQAHYHQQEVQQFDNAQHNQWGAAQQPQPEPRTEQQPGAGKPPYPDFLA